MLKKIPKSVLIILVIAIAGLWVFWPKNFAVNGPLLDFITGKQAETPTTEIMRTRFNLPLGFRIGLFAGNVNNVRSLQITETGDIVAASMRGNEIVLLHRNEDGDGASDGRTVLSAGRNHPHGIALHDGYLYAADTDRVVRFPFDAAARLVGQEETVFTGMPLGGNHTTRTIAFGPDGMLYITVGSSCNVCIEEEPYRASMLRMTPEGNDVQTYATGLRNSVGFDWQPGTGNLFATDNGRDLLGDDTPHCELNLIEEGADYGWPFAYDDRQIDPDYGIGNESRVAASRPMYHGFGAHRAPLGIRFLNPENAPSGYENAALVALHGSWNRSTLAGYKVVSLHFAEDGAVEQRDFLTGFELDEDVIGRPVEIIQGKDGAIYVSDDYSGSIYKIGWGDMVVPGFEAVAKEVVDPLADYSDADVEFLAEAGSETFRDYGCASCHDASASAEGVAVKELKGLAVRYDVPALQQLFKVPPSSMPSFEFSEEESRALAVYLLSTFGNIPK
ncbi:PQQ-dependent sugar dehydrogenase [Kordiimonas aquimaris]|uniref:PQQ-dependent sugar dehydrogenase n=1 Tax=Kordiimonas aquimaris TaxID=707591 RepID=UPI0021D3D5D2|nr:PQQ-dependent sugar dehydrogenase [Kordiimonas aquimaris]